MKMAAISCGTCKCYRSKLFTFPKNALEIHRSAVFRVFSSQVEAEKIEFNRRKKRDRLTVLKALSSTVERVPNRPDYRFYDDTVLNPRSLLKQKELHLAMESGEKAADYILQKYPELFPLRKPVPDWPKSQSVNEFIEDTVENLQFLIQHGEDKQSKVLDMYENLKAAGELPIDVHNTVLDFVSFHGVAQSSQGIDQIKQSTTDTSSSSSSSSSEDEEKGDTVETQDSKTKSTWRSDGYAESLFTELKQLGNSQTYEVFILALLKHGEYIRAFHLFREFQKREFTGTLFFYNKLLSHVTDVRTDDTGKWDLVQEIIANMKKNSIKPDAATYNSLLGTASTMENNPQQLSHELLREMKRLKITPTLGCYYHILFTERKKNYQNINLLLEIVSDLKSGIVDFNLQHPTDTLFFHSAMDLTRFKRHAVIARDLLDIVFNNNLLHLLAGKQSAFFGNYLCAIARNATNIDDVMEEYENLVPKHFIPRDWVYQQLLLACRNLNRPEHVPKLYADMVVMRVVLSERLANALYASMEQNIPKENAGEFANVVKQSLKWMEVFRVKMTPQILNTSIKVFCLNEVYEDARIIMEDAKRNNITPSGELKAISEGRDMDSIDTIQYGVMNSKYRKWPNAVVPYDLTPIKNKVLGKLGLKGPTEKAILKAMAQWENKTCIRFIERTNQKDYIEFIDDGYGKCYSYVGRSTGKQKLSLGFECFYEGIAIHEIGHALGLHHEQSRPDRDDYVEIIWSNIKQAYKPQFEKYTHSRIDSLGSPYDYDSIMHYRKTAFAKFPFLRTIRAKKPNVKFGQRSHISVQDAWQINKLYGCPV